jgi:hypothetical protein
MALAHLGQELRAVHLGHAHVRQHQIHRLLGQHLQALGPAGGQQHGVALPAEEATQGVEHARFIVHQEQGGALEGARDTRVVAVVSLVISGSQSKLGSG